MLMILFILKRSLKWELMEILVTGAAGFIGSQLAASLATLGHKVVGVDSLTEYYSVALKKARISSLLRPSDVEFKVLDLSNPDAAEKLIEEGNFEAVFHMAAQPGVRLDISDHSIYVRDNLVAFSNILINVVRYQVPNFMYASSSSVYGDTAKLPYSEKETYLTPQSFYGATKLSNEVLTKSLIHSSNTRARALRFFSVYGPWGRPDMAYFKIANSIADDELFKVFGDGSKARDFTYIEDVITMTNKLFLDLTNLQAGYSDVVNIGGGTPASLNELIMILEILGKKSPRIQYSEPLSSDVEKTIADTSLQRALVGASPNTSLVQGLTEFWKWHQDKRYLE